jgi:hypothetical protein
MQIENNILINDLVKRTERSTDKVRIFQTLPIEQLQHKNGNQWNILECLEHLNLYGDFYLPEIEKQIIANQHKPASSTFQSGLVGNYFANLMEVKDGKIKKMKSPKDKNPSNTALSVTTISRFFKQQERLLNLLQQSRKVDLTRTKTAISLSSLIRLRLGDTLRFYTYHIERHVWQAERIMEAINTKPQLTNA